MFQNNRYSLSEIVNLLELQIEQGEVWNHEEDEAYQKYTAIEQQNLHLYSRYSTPCLLQICTPLGSEQPPQINSSGLYWDESRAWTPI